MQFFTKSLIGSLLIIMLCSGYFVQGKEYVNYSIRHSKAKETSDKRRRKAEKANSVKSTNLTEKNHTKAKAKKSRKVGKLLTAVAKKSTATAKKSTAVAIRSETKFI